MVEVEFGKDRRFVRLAGGKSLIDQVKDMTMVRNAGEMIELLKAARAPVTVGQKRAQFAQLSDQEHCGDAKQNEKARGQRPQLIEERR